MAGLHGTFGGLGRFAGPWLLILASLADGPKHGYVIMIDVACFSGVSIVARCPGWSAAAGCRRWLHRTPPPL